MRFTRYPTVFCLGMLFLFNNYLGFRGVIDAAQFSNEPVQRVWFYKPPSDGNLDTLVKYFGDYILTKRDEATRDALKAKGVNVPFMQYLLANEIEDPGSCTAQPNRNQVADQIGDFCNISSQHPDWFLLDVNGKRIGHSYGTKTLYYMDPANTGWRAFWLSRAKVSQETLGWDGVFLDNVEGSISKFTRMGVTLSKYRDDASWNSAVSGYLSYVYNNYFKSSGRPLMGNIVEVRTPSVWFSYLNYMNGGMLEAFAVDWNTGYRSNTDWLEHLSRTEQTQNSGKRIILVSQGAKTNSSRQQFSYASYLLVANGRASFRYADNSYYGEAWIYSNYDLDLGVPLGPRYQSNGLWHRDFSNGKVTVDPGAHTGAITIGGGTSGGGGGGTTTSTAYLKYEGEVGSLFSPMKKLSSSSAQGGYYVSVPNGSGNFAGSVKFSLSIPADGRYILWARIRATSSGGNSFNIQMNGGSKVGWTLPISSSWAWRRYEKKGSPVQFELIKGTHTLSVHNREDGTELDAIVFTNDVNYAPGQ